MNSDFQKTATETIEMIQIRGELTKIFDTVQVTADFKRRNVIVTTSENEMGRQEVLSVEFFQDHCNIADSFKVGQKVIMNVRLKGRKWTDSEGVDKYFNTIQAWKMVTDKNDN